MTEIVIEVVLKRRVAPSKDCGHAGPYLSKNLRAANCKNSPKRAEVRVMTAVSNQDA